MKEEPELSRGGRLQMPTAWDPRAHRLGYVPPVYGPVGQHGERMGGQRFLTLISKHITEETLSELLEVLT